MRLHRFAVPLLLVSALGCAGAPPAVPPAPVWAFASASPTSGKELRMRAEARYIQVSIDGDSIFGPNWQLKHGGTYIRGFGEGNTSVQLTLKGTHADGNMLNNPFSVDLSPQGDGVTQVSGLFGGAISVFKISPTIFQGQLGPCSYDLKYNGTRYEGMASCNKKAPSITTVELPVAMASWTDLEVATVLAIVLGT